MLHPKVFYSKCMIVIIYNDLKLEFDIVSDFNNS